MLNMTLLSRMSQKSQHTRYEEIILGRSCCREAPQFVPACDADINYDFCFAVVADGDVVKVKKTEVRQARSRAPLGPQSSSLLDFYSL